MPTAEEIAEIQAQWQAEGLDSDEIGERLRVLAEIEAERAEADEADEAEGAEEEEAGDDVTAQVAQANAVYVGSIAAIFGADTDIQPCPYCQGLGFEAIEWPQDPHAHRCDTCKGLGNVITGSLVTGNEKRICVDCNGAGFVAEVVTPAQPPAPTFVPVVPTFVPPIAAA